MQQQEAPLSSETWFKFKSSRRAGETFLRMEVSLQRRFTPYRKVHYCSCSCFQTQEKTGKYSVANSQRQTSTKYKLLYKKIHLKMYINKIVNHEYFHLLNKALNSYRYKLQNIVNKSTP